MADYIPFAVEEEILIRLPTRSSIVSKTWRALSYSSKFIADYSIQQTHQHYLLVNYYDLIKNEQKFYSVVDDDTFPQQKFPLNIYPICRRVTRPVVLGVSQGVFCLDVRVGDDEAPDTRLIFLWNPSIRKSIPIAAPEVLGCGYRNAIGFGVCPHTNDPMLVNIKYRLTFPNTRPHPWQIEVYALSSRVWRSVPPFYRPRNTIVVKYSQVAIDEFIFWLAIAKLTMNPNELFYNLIMSFDMTNDEITEVSLPYSLAQHAPCHNVALSSLNGSLVVLQTIEEAEKQVFNVWMMKRGVPNSFTKLFFLSAPDASIKALQAFRKNNEPIFGMVTDSYAHDVFVNKLNSENQLCWDIWDDISILHENTTFALKCGS